MSSTPNAKRDTTAHTHGTRHTIKHYVIDVITFDLSDIERSVSRSVRFWRLTPRKGAELGHMLLLNTNRKPYMWSPMTLSHLTLSYLERSISRSLRCQRVISRKGAEVGHMLPLNINRKPYMGSPLVWLYLTLVTLKDQCHSDFESLYRIKELR